MDLKSIVEKYRPGFEKKYATRITREQAAAIEAMLNCRTERYWVVNPASLNNGAITAAAIGFAPAASIMIRPAGYNGSLKSYCLLTILW